MLIQRVIIPTQLTNNNKKNIIKQHNGNHTLLNTMKNTLVEMHGSKDSIVTECNRVYGQRIVSRIRQPRELAFKA